MANPNVEIWGAPETWISAPYTGGETGALAESLKITAPKCPDFGTDSNKTRLNSGITSGRITANEPLDLTICPCGQDEQISAYGKLAIFNESGDGSLTPRIVERNSPCNWFMFDQYESYDIEKMVIKRAYNYSSSRGMKFDQWSPNAVINSYNNNGYISPFLMWYTRSIVLRIEVKAFTSAGNSGTNGGWITLDEWKNSYSNENICGIRFKTMCVNSLNSQTMILSYNNSTPAQDHHAGKIAILDTIPNINNNGTLTDTTFYSFFQTSDRGREGVIFDETYGSGNTTNMCILPCWNYFDDQTINRGGNSSWGYYYYYSIPYSDDTYEKIMKLVACFGCYFTPTNKTDFAYAMTDVDLCLPVIDENGVTHGEYTRGADNVNNDLYEMNSIRDKNYDPSRPPTPTDPNTYSNTSYFKFVDLGNIGCKRYALSAISVNSLIGDLWSLLGTFSQDSFDDFTQKVQAGFLVTNPIDSIVSLMCFPFIVPNVGTDEPIKLGKYDMTARGTPVTRATYSINFSGIPLFPRFGGCYLDYEPYTNYEIYVPFCGTIPLKAADILGHTLNVKLIVDLYTGSCTGYVLADDLVIETITGTVAITIPITGMDSATINSQIVNANLNYKSSLYAAGSTIGSMVSIGGLVNALSNPADAVNKIAQSQIAEEQAEYELKHIPTQPHMIGASSPALGWCCDTIARVMIYYPTGEVINDSKPPSLITDKINSFGHLNGFACVDWGKVSEYHGYTVGNIRLDNVPCTESERARIRQLFATGVVLP